MKVIDDIGLKNVVVVVTDNAQAETTAWDHIRKHTYDHYQILCTGDCGHGGNLLFKEICNFPQAEKNVEVDFIVLYMHQNM